ncbi:MAG: amidohydrolase [Clostridia bacterium]|nr:amidohydrolase [Clostridia bacterium]
MSYTTAYNVIDKEADKLIDLAQKMWHEPETAYNEVKACAWLAEALKEYGFEVEIGLYGMPTSIRATWGKGHPVIGILGEYDALPGMSQKVQTTKEAVVSGAPGQGCAHNLLGTTSLGAVLGIKAELEEKGLEGTVVFYGCPGEEVLTGKAFMAREGAFRDLDLAFSWHGSTTNEVTDGIMTGLNSAIFHFKGRTAHAGGDPYNGRSALDAAEIMSVGANYLREHVTGDVRIHYVYKEAGTAPNIVPDKAAVWYYVRAFSREAIEDTYKRLIKCAEGAAHMTETEVEIEFLGGCYNTLNNKVLIKASHEALLETPLPVWTEEELAFADELNKLSPMYDNMVQRGTAHPSIHSSVLDIQHTNGYGSTDVGDVMHIVPCAQVMTATSSIATPGHSWQLTACAGHSIGHKGMIYGAKVMAAAAMKFYEDKALVEAAKAEFNESMNGKTYNCPIPKEVPIPQPQK